MNKSHAERVLAHQKLWHRPDPLVHCPVCNSEDTMARLVTTPVTDATAHFCQNCQHRWNTLK